MIGKLLSNLTFNATFRNTHTHTYTESYSYTHILTHLHRHLNTGTTDRQTTVVTCNISEGSGKEATEAVRGGAAEIGGRGVAEGKAEAEIQKER